MARNIVGWKNGFVLQYILSKETQNDLMERRGNVELALLEIYIKYFTVQTLWWVVVLYFDGRSLSCIKYIVI